MKSILGCLRPGVVFVFVFVSCSVVASLGNLSLSTEDASRAPCAPPTYHEFDFWIGDWEVFEVGSRNKVAHARVDSILDGCVLREDYRGADGHEGESFTNYDAAKSVWHQTWVTNRGELLEIEGKIENGAMVLSGKNQAGALVRGEWKPVNGEVREVAVTSTDSGKTWKPWFDLMFRPSGGVDTARKMFPTEDKGSDKETVAALDTQYQAAVKQNDAATMDRILVPDFTLVTGSGKTYTKADLLAEARSGRVHYERQDDTERTVRVWGDTAVITARLVEIGTDDGKPFAKTVWFSDTYVRTPAGWRYIFGQSSLPLAENRQ